MALRLRRGTDAERLLITPLEGELIYTTDTKKLYVGDGITVGGVAVDTNAGGISDLENSSINDLGDVNADSTVPNDGDVLTFDATSGDWRAAAPTGAGGGATQLSELSDVDATVVNPGDSDVLMYDHVQETWTASSLAGRDYNISIRGNDSTILVDSIGNILRGNLIGNVTGDVVGNVTGNATGDHTGTFTGEITATGTLDGDVIGSVFGQDSTPIIDGINSSVIGRVENESVITDNMAAGDIRIGGATTNLITTIDPATTNLNIATTNTNGTIISNRPFRIGGISANYSNGFLTVYNNAALSSAINVINNVEDQNGTALAISRSRGTKASPSAVQSGDFLGAFITTGYNGSNYVSAGGINVVASDTPGANKVPATINLFTSENSGVPTTRFSVNDAGVASFTGPAQLVVYADPSTRDTAIPSPTAGMMVFLTDSTGAGGAAKAQVNTDSTTGGWVDLH